jgi:E3 ubiquitin-protein ligase HERC4
VLLLFLRVLSRINTEHGYPIGYETFYIPEVREAHNLPESYVRWLVDVQNGVDVSAGFYICNYPFMFDPSAKEAILKTDQAFSQQQAQQNSLIQTIFSGHAQIPYLMLMVSRQNIVNETIIQLQNSTTADLKKPLRVKFADEEAEDAGGVTKEFFMLLIKEILNPDYGMFKEYEESNAMWFNPMTFEDNSYYFLIGILYGLAIYNFTIINVPFPLVLYDKLLKEESPVYGPADLAQLSPTTARSLQQLIDYTEPDAEEVFGLSFTVTESQFGEATERPLKLGGEEMVVTNANKSEYVKLYIDYVLNKSCETQFDAFKKGFLKVVSQRVLQLFHPQELMALVVGNENYDWDVMQEIAAYKEGYSPNHPTIVFFWEVFHEFAAEDKKKFLLFLTGSDRIPIAGMSSVKIMIQKTADTAFLPVAHTCFNLLDLPEYTTKEKLHFKLLQAIQCTKGFGLV